MKERQRDAKVDRDCAPEIHTASVGSGGSVRRVIYRVVSAISEIPTKKTSSPAAGQKSKKSKKDSQTELPGCRIRVNLVQFTCLKIA